MASVNGGRDLQVRVVNRRLVKASDSAKPHVLSLSNLDLLQTIQASMFCIYRKPLTGDFNAVVAAFESGLPSLLNHFFPFAGRIATDPTSGLPEVRCGNQGAELVVGEAGVALASLDYGAVGAAVRRIQLPYGEDVALSVQVVSFACGGFTVAWCTSHVLVDGKSLSFLVSAWSELARTGALAAASLPNHDRSVFRPRAPPTYSATLDEAFTPLDGKRQINVLTANQSFVERMYYVEASDIERLRRAASRDDGGGPRATRVQAVSAYLWKALASVVAGTAEARCRMGWRVNGRRRVEDPERRAAMRNYVGNFITYVVEEASVEEVLQRPLPEVAAMVREAIAAPAYEEHFQELMDWVEEHKPQGYLETAILGLGSPILSVTTLSSAEPPEKLPSAAAAEAMNKRPRDDPSSSFGSAPKRQYGAGGGYGAQQGYSEERSSARRVADHYSARSNQTLEERENSPIIHLKKLNNWIKSVLIQLYARPGDCVLDLACGKGGDLIKWDKAKVGYYVGVDIAEGSIKDCMTRYNGDTDQQRRKKFSFPARLICTDCYEARLDEYLYEDAPFDICSCQFALHYSWSTEARARQALANVSALLRPGGIFIGTMPDANVIIKRLRESEGLEFGNSVYWISFGEEYAEKKFPASRPFGIKYKFHLEDAVDCPEWVVPFHLFKLLAEEYDLELVLMKNFHEFVHEYLQKPEFTELMRRLGALGDGRQDQSTLSQDEWEVSYLYLAFVLRKRGQPPSQRRSNNANRGKMFLTEGDIEFVGI